MRNITTKRGVLPLVSVFLVCHLLATPAETMEVPDVIGLVQAEVNDDTIIAILREKGTAFQLSAEDRHKLRTAGASERLLTFMNNPAEVPPPVSQATPTEKNKHRSSPPAGKPAGSSMSTFPTQSHNVPAGLSQGQTSDQKELWQGSVQDRSRQPIQPIMPPQSVQDRQVLEIPPVQPPQESGTTLARIPSQVQRKQAEPPAPGRTALLTLTLTNRQEEYITGVGKGDLRLSVDGRRCEILSLTSDQHTPVSIGILLDTSGSMIDKLAEAEDGLHHFVNTLHPEDEVFLFAFNDTPQLVQDFTNNREALGRALGTLQARGSTALYDVLAAGLTQIQAGRHRKKVLLLITDGNDTASRMSLDQVMDVARSTAVLIYSLGIGHGGRGSFGHMSGGLFGDVVDVAALQALSRTTGGKTFIVQGAHVVAGIDVIDQAVQRIAAELRLQYTLRYPAVCSSTGGEGHSVRVESPRRDVIVRARSGYAVE